MTARKLCGVLVVSDCPDLVRKECRERKKVARSGRRTGTVRREGLGGGLKAPPPFFAKITTNSAKHNLTKNKGAKNSRPLEKLATRSLKND